MLSTAAEKKIALIHRALVPDKEYPREYAILVTDHRSIFIRQKKTRSSFVLRQEMRFGTALVTDSTPKTMEDYNQTDLDALSADEANLTVPNGSVTSLVRRADPPDHRKRDFFVWMVMKRQNEIFQVYNFEMTYRQDPTPQATIRFYAVSLGAYVKPRRQTQTRETILREYSDEIAEIYRRVLPESTLLK